MIRLSMAALLTVVLSACSLHAINDRTFVTDADTRAIIRTNAVWDDSGQFLKPDRITCAEPSPDIAKLITTTSSTGGQLGVALPSTISASAAYNLARGQSEGLAQLTDRLATIQILRDSMYRACEAYANGAIDRITYSLVVAHSERLMLGLLVAELGAGRTPQPLLQMAAGDIPSIGVSPSIKKATDDAADQGNALTASVDKLKKLASGTIKKADLDELSKVAPTSTKTGILGRLLPTLAPDVQTQVHDVVGKADKLHTAQKTLNKVLEAESDLPSLRTDDLVFPGFAAANPGSRASRGKHSNNATTSTEPADDVEARLQFLAVLIQELVGRPTLDGIEVACVTALSRPQAKGDQQAKGNQTALQELCNTELPDVVKYKINANYAASHLKDRVK